jgi:hypothetical protein
MIRFLQRRCSDAGRSAGDRGALGVAQAMAMSIVLFAGSSARAGELFDIEPIESHGRTVAAEFAELNGDARTDLLVVVLIGIPPEERRRVRVYLQRPDGSLPPAPDHTIAIPPWSGLYDLADLKESPGEELVLLRPDGVTLLSLADASGRSWHLSAPGPTTLGPADDERGLGSFPLVYRDFGPEPWLLVPQVGQLLALSPEGEVRARLETPRRVNYFTTPRSGLVSLESDLQLFIDAPKLAVGDVDGDGRADLVLSTRHEIWVYLRREDGSLPPSPDRRLAPHLLTPRDHIRGSGGVACLAEDIDGDGKLDLLVSHIAGNLTEASSTTYIHMNRDGAWDLEQPDQVFHSEASLETDALLDLDGDGRTELLRMNLRFSLLEVVEFLLTRDIDIQVSVHRFLPDGGFEERPWLKTQIELPVDFDSSRLAGFLPRADVDLNGDGFPDFVLSGGGEAIEISLGGGKDPFAGPTFRQKMSTAGVIRFGDLDGD